MCKRDLHFSFLLPFLIAELSCFNSSEKRKKKSECYDISGVEYHKSNLLSKHKGLGLWRNAETGQDRTRRAVFLKQIANPTPTPQCLALAVSNAGVILIPPRFLGGPTSLLPPLTIQELMGNFSGFRLGAGLRL